MEHFARRHKKTLVILLVLKGKLKHGSLLIVLASFVSVSYQASALYSLWLIILNVLSFILIVIDDIVVIALYKPALCMVF